MLYYKVPILNGMFNGVNYNNIIEGIAFERHVVSGYGYIATNISCPEFESISQETFDVERRQEV